jgi:iron complex transport system substrate-binding protein
MTINNQLHSDFSSGGRLGKAKVISLFACVLFTLVLVFVLKINSSHIGIIIPSSATAGQEEVIEEVDKSGIRIATLLPFAADQLIAMGCDPVCVPRISGETPAEWEGIPEVQLDHSLGPNLEELIAVNPDIIITGSTYAQFMPQIESITHADVVFMDINSIDSAQDHIRRLSEIIGEPTKGQEMIRKINLDIGSAISVEDKPRVLALFGTPASFYAFLPSSYLGDLINHSGGELGPSGLTSHKIYAGLAPLSMEMVIAFEPDILFVLFHGPVETSRSLFENDPLWGALDSVKNNHMYFLEDDRYVMRPGSNLYGSINEIKGYINNYTANIIAN